VAHGANENILQSATERSGNELSADSRVRQHETIAPRDSLYIPSLDGIRAISFFLVFFAHAGLGAIIIPGGFGVTIFFLLSGYLITTLLRLEFARYRRISLGGFYLRRVLRILPPLYVVLVLAVLLYRIGWGQSPIPVAGTVSQILQVSNYYQIYAMPAITMPGTGLLWSLAVEEHFYLLFPLLYVWMCPRFSGNRQAIILLGLCAAALAWRCILHFHFHADLMRSYYATDTRFDSILFGCAFAIAANPILHDPLHEWSIRQMKWLVPLSVIVLLATFLLRNDGFRDTLRYTLQGLALIPLFIAAIHYQKSWPVLFLNLPFVRFLGVLSYTLYLCHSVIMESVAVALPDRPVLTGAISLACALGFATLVHYGVERPCTKIRKRLSKALKAPPAAMGVQ
jgi:peptidoglycan/LPS O-acetylase OafA/YrhL